MSKNREILKALGLINQIGLSMMVPIFMGLFFGQFLDGWLETSPLFMILFLMLGIFAGFRNLFVLTQSFRDKENGKDDKWK